MKFSRLFFLLWMILFSQSVLAQIDSITPINIKSSISFISEENFNPSAPLFLSLDSSLTGTDRVNPSLDLHYNFLGTLGSASDPQIYSNRFSVLTFTGVRSFDPYLILTDSIKYYRTNKRFSEVDYHTGAFKEQSISIFHTQNITRDWNAGFLFDRQSVHDFMNFSNTFRSRFNFFTWYKTPSDKYTFFAHAIWNSIKNDVNGGLTSDSLFDNTNVSNLGIQGLAYHISNASEHVRHRTFHLSQYLNTGKITKDSTGKIISRGFPLVINHRISLTRKSFTYADTDPDSSFYDNFFYGSSTMDSLHSDELTNRFALKILNDTGDVSFLQKLMPEVYTEHQHVSYGQRTDSSWNNLTVGAKIFYSGDSSNTKILIDAKEIIAGMDKGNYSIDGKISYRIGENNFAGFDASIQKCSPDLIYRLYDGNNFRWRNFFNDLSVATYGLNFESQRWKSFIEGRISTIKNYVFFNTVNIPVQISNKVNIAQIFFRKNFNYRSLHFDNYIVYQKTDHVQLSIPNVVTDQSLYIQKKHFNDALLAAYGFSFNFNSSYFANAFMPATAQFYLQNEKKTGGYLRIDLFVNLKIKTAKLFLKIENVADGLIDRSYYLVPHYPMPGRVIKFGIAWRFFDQ